MYKRSVFYLLLFALLVTAPVQGIAQLGTPVPYENGVVSSTDKHASAAGLEMLQRGGNAVDAAIAVQFALAVTAPHAGNIGGGGFMMIHLEDGTVRALDFRETAPARATRDMFLDEDGEYIPERSRVGGLASGVPGTVDGMINALERHGTLPLEIILQPAINLALEGFPISHQLAEILNLRTEELSLFEGSKAVFVRSDGREWRAGDRLIQRELGETLQRIARQGRNGFYSGVTARLIVQEMERTGGIITLRDLRNYKSVWREPVKGEFNGYDIYMLPPPSSGGLVVRQILGMIGDIDTTQTQFNSAEYIHLLTESMRRSFADRNYYLGDPDFVDIPAKELVSDSYLKSRMNDFNPVQATSSEDISEGDITISEQTDETTHFSVIDRNGNAVSVTTTINGWFGNYVTVTGAGFLLNNEMDDFSAKPGEPNMFGLIGAEANAIEPNKRMLSSMTPLIAAKDGKVRFIAGGAGGPRIITATLQNFLNIVLYGMNIQESISAPRFHHQWLPDQIYFEPWFSPDTKALLKAKGHTVTTMPNIGRTHNVYIDEEGKRFGAADPRGYGTVKGY